MRAAALLLTLAACSSAEDRWNIVVLPELCAAQASCSDRVEADACVDVARSVDYSACTLDPQAVRDCQRALEDATCVEVPFMGYDTLDTPEPCDAVWQC